MPRPISTLLASALLILAATASAQAGSSTQAGAAFGRGDFVKAARLLPPLAERGDRRAQAMLGFMYATGQGVPQAYDAAAYWYRRSAEQGDTTAQYLLGLMYDKGHGVPLDEVAAYTWLNLAAAGAPKRLRENYQRLRDAVASKMSRRQIAEGQWRALDWAATPRR
ncbi:tetratricopeptide repeat protein [Rhodopseudomonas sp. NSM]|uniref:tetratricopeptide repeat protein n=1 Tax=Rhodopseudomonas sp. NSM TaxID=3457630 RepID=UPI0040354E12